MEIEKKLPPHNPANFTLKSEKDIRGWLAGFDIRNFEITSDLIVNVNENVDLEARRLLELPFQFGVIKGDFTISYNKLTSLKGSPFKVTEYFRCNGNPLLSLEYAPREVYDFDCSRCGLRTLVHGPEKVWGAYQCDNNQLTNLEGLPEHMSGPLNASSNQLESITGLSDSILHNLYLNDNPLKINEIRRLKDFHIGMYVRFTLEKEASELEEYSGLTVQMTHTELKSYLLSLELQETLPHNQSVSKKMKI